MRRQTIGFALFVACWAFAAPAWAQHEGHASGSAGVPGVSAQLVTQCVESQRQSLGLVETANARVESARQSNSPSEIRASMADLQRTLLDMRTVLARCTELQQAPDAAPAAASIAGHDMSNMPGVANAPGAITPQAADPHAGHVLPAAPPAQGAANMPGHNMANMPGPQGPAAADPHAGHVVPPNAATAAATGHTEHAVVPQARTAAAKVPAAVGTGSAKADTHAAHATSAGDAASPAGQAAAIDPVCGLTVDPADAPSATYQGQTYYFCSLQHQRSFLKEPPKYIPKARK
jgi:YHS domain-containing protein